MELLRERKEQRQQAVRSRHANGTLGKSEVLYTIMSFGELHEHAPCTYMYMYPLLLLQNNTKRMATEKTMQLFSNHGGEKSKPIIAVCTCNIHMAYITL